MAPDPARRPAPSPGRPVATSTTVDLAGLLAFARERHDVVLTTRRADDSLQSSPVTCGVDPAGRFVISTYPDRAKAVNLRRDPRASLVVLSPRFGDAWVQVDGTAEVIDGDDAVEPLVEYFRCISGSTPTGRSTGRRCGRRASR